MVKQDNKEETKEENEKGKTISIRGIKEDAYRRMTRLAKETGKTIGEITNDAYHAFIASVEGAKRLSREFIEGLNSTETKSISNLKKVTISGSDLKEIDGPIRFSNIDDLRFESVDPSDFEKKVASIVNVKTLTIPKSISKSKVLLKCSFVDEIIQA
ncbi:MAG TPA: hypothetical protein VKU79_03220 [Thermoplasmataceae archaeon]|nr:hypothetical protein [Thermoplasmatales archaeon AK]HLH85860.1 hypothetical protein [Thermoplasmataceae archaeon]